MNLSRLNNTLTLLIVYSNVFLVHISTVFSRRYSERNWDVKLTFRPAQQWGIAFDSWIKNTARFLFLIMYSLTVSYNFPAVFNSSLSLLRQFHIEHGHGLDLDTSHREEIRNPQCSCCIKRHVDESYLSWWSWTI